VGSKRLPNGDGGLLSSEYIASKDFIQQYLLPFAKVPVGKCSAWIVKKSVMAGILIFCKQNKLPTLYKLGKAMHTIPDNKILDSWLSTC